MKYTTMMTLFLFAICSVYGGDWTVLGSRTVKFSADRDVIPVTGSQGTFKRLKLRVKKSGIRVMDMKVHFGDGSVHDVSIRKFIKAGGETRVIDLPGSARVIRKVVLTYKTKNKRKGGAVVTLWGKH